MNAAPEQSGLVPIYLKAVTQGIQYRARESGLVNHRSGHLVATEALVRLGTVGSAVVAVSRLPS